MTLIRSSAHIKKHTDVDLKIILYVCAHTKTIP